MKCVILQPSYIPWRGYFHQIQKADVFVFLDCVQYDNRSWRNRNKIKTQQGTTWLTIPVRSKGHQTNSTAIKDIPIIWDAEWAKKHRTAIRHSYGKAPHFENYQDLMEEIYSRRDPLLSDFTCATTVSLSRALGIEHTQFVRSSSLPIQGAKGERLLSILTHLGATHYISGPSARSYMNLSDFEAVGIEVEFMDYNYPEYPQLGEEFRGEVSVLDLMFNVGAAAPQWIWATD